MTHMRLSALARGAALGLLVALLCSAVGQAADGETLLSGELNKWHAVTLTFRGPGSGEDATPNPFRDYRLTVTFARGDKSHTVQGYFAADGNAGETSATSGDTWRVHFVPDEEGEWRWRASFRAGEDVAVSEAPEAGTATAFDGASGSFTVGATDKAGRDLRGKGLLPYVGGHYLRFAETGEYFLKGGADSPENFLAYADFDQTPATHRYGPHAGDYRPGDPTWQGGKGKSIVGALNYLASKGMNSVYFLTMNVGGDGKDVWPWTSKDERHRFDCSKLDQWEMVFSHMDRLGIMLHVITQEQENDQLLDEGELGVQRKLYYRELVARFGHHLAVTWNLGEENTNTDEQRMEFCRYIKGLDPYDHAIVCHTFPGAHEKVYRPLLGDEHFDGPSLQTGASHARTRAWRERSEAAGRKWVVCLDEIGPANTGVKPDADDPEHDEVRTKHLWGALMAGAAGVEWYFGYRYAHNDLNCEDWRSRERLWDQTRHALEFFQQHLPFHEMRPADELTTATDDYCLAKPGNVYAVYLPKGGTTLLNIGNMPSAFDVRWYNPRTGGELQRGVSLRGAVPRGMLSLGLPPSEREKDWVALVTASVERPTYALVVEGGVGTGEYPVGAAVPVSAPLVPEGKGFQQWEGQTEGLADAKRAETILIMPERDVRLRPEFGEGGGGPGPSVVSFTLIDADTNQPIAGFDPIKNGARVDPGKLPSPNLNIRANVSDGAVSEVRFSFDGRTKAEAVAPYALGGDRGGDYGAMTLAPGEHKLSARAVGAGGAVGRACEVEFEVVDG